MISQNRKTSIRKKANKFETTANNRRKQNILGMFGMTK